MKAEEAEIKTEIERKWERDSVTDRGRETEIKLESRVI